MAIEGAYGIGAILVVEDSALIGMDAQEVLELAGLRVLGPVADLAQAQSLAGSADISAAILDVDLEGRPVWPVAESLRARGVPFAFTTGYSSAADIPASLRDAPILAKPFRDRELVELVRSLLQPHP